MHPRGRPLPLPPSTDELYLLRRTDAEKPTVLKRKRGGPAGRGAPSLDRIQAAGRRRAFSRDGPLGQIAAYGMCPLLTASRATGSLAALDRLEREILLTKALDIIDLIVVLVEMALLIEHQVLE